MATGSRKYFQYTSDSGDLYAMNLDESTYETVALGFGQTVDTENADYVGVLSATGTRPLSPRYFNVVGTDADNNTVKRRIFVGDADAAAWDDPQSFEITLLTVSGNVATPTVFRVTSAIGERRVFIPAIDTGLTDGDRDSNLTAPPV